MNADLSGASSQQPLSEETVEDRTVVVDPDSSAVRQNTVEERGPVKWLRRATAIAQFANALLQTTIVAIQMLSQWSWL